MKHVQTRFARTTAPILCLAAVAHAGDRPAPLVEKTEPSAVRYAQDEAAAFAAKLAGANAQALSLLRPDRSFVHHDEVDGAVWSRGARYKARFGVDGVQYVPFFGSDAPRNVPLSLALAAFEVGGAAQPLDEAAQPVRAADRIVFDRGTLREVYDTHVDGLKQSFVVDELARRDRLTVRVAFQGDYEALQDGERVRFVNLLGSIACSSTVVYDAAGRSIELPTLVQDGELVLDVPEAFVASAELPLTIDPNLTTLTINDSSSDTFGIDAAYDQGHSLWRVTYEERYSAEDSDVYTIGVNHAGQAVGGSGVYIDLSTTRWARPRIAHVLESDRFLVVAEVGAVGARQIHGRTVADTIFTLGGHFRIDQAGNGDRQAPDVGGTPMAVNTNFLVAWEVGYPSGDFDVVGRAVLGSGSPAGGEFMIAVTTKKERHVSVSDSTGHEGGTGPRFVVAWDQEFTAIDRDIWAARFNGIVQPDGPAFPVSTSSLDEANPSASTLANDASGSRPYAIAWEAQVATGNRDVLVAMLSGSSVLEVVNFSSLGVGANRDQTQPVVVTDGSQYTVAYTELFEAADTDVAAYHFAWDGNDVLLNGPRETLASTNGPERNAVVFAANAQAEGSNRLMYAWDGDAGSHDDVFAAVATTPAGGPIVNTCYGSVAVCPCGNTGSFGHGCANSVVSSGALLAASGAAKKSNDTLQLTVTGLPATVNCLFFQGTAFSNGGTGTSFGDGVLCANGTVVRLGTKLSSAGSASFPAAGDLDVSVKGLVPTSGGTRSYQVWYRNASAFCTASTFNLSNGLKVTWIL